MELLPYRDKVLLRNEAFFGDDCRCDLLFQTPQISAEANVRSPLSVGC